MGNLQTVTAFLLLGAGAMAQTAGRPEFEVASIKPTASGLGGVRGGWFQTGPGGRVNITHLTLKDLIAHAYRIQAFQIYGGPAWLDSLRYDISAKAEATFKQDELPLMLQSLLADRFQLTIHRETKDLPIYALVLAKKDGKLGPGLVESKAGGCTMRDPSKPPPRPEPGKLPAPLCGQMMTSPRLVRAASLPLAALADTLSRVLGRTVVDKTGLTGTFDISLQWTPDEGQAMQLPPDLPKPSQSDVAGPSIFTALQEQLGLKLETQKGPVDILVITRAEKPSEN